MEIILSQVIHLKPMNKGVAIVTKSFISDVIPRTGDTILDTVWKADEEPKVGSVEINYQENCCFVHLDPVVLQTEDESVLKEYVKMTKLHEWESSYNTDD